MQSLVIVTVVALLGAVTIGVHWRFTRTRDCLQHGYTTYAEGFCIKRVNQTDVVTPITELK